MEFLWPGMRRENSTGVFDCHVDMYVKGRHFIAMRRQAGQPATGRDAGKPDKKLLPTPDHQFPCCEQRKTDPSDFSAHCTDFHVFTCS